MGSRARYLGVAVVVDGLMEPGLVAAFLTALFASSSFFCTPTSFVWNFEAISKVFRAEMKDFEFMSFNACSKRLFAAVIPEVSISGSLVASFFAAASESWMDLRSYG